MNDTEIQERAYRVIGTRPIRQDGTDKVTGRALFGADIRLSGMLYGAVLRSPHAHARILAIDAHQAEAMPGVKAVVTATDLPPLKDQAGDGSASLHYQRNNILARGKVLYYGHAVAAVAATDPNIAAEATRRIQVTYEILPPVLDVQQAMQEGAPILLDDLRTDELGKKGEKPTNIVAHHQQLVGDLEKGFAEAEAIVEREFVTASVHQGYIEPHNATALYNPDGQVTIWCSSQFPFGVRDQVASILQMPVSKIRVIPLEIGGGFGGKNTVYLQPLAVLLSKKSGYKPVKMTMSYRETLAATGPAAASYISVKMAADKSGHITAAEATIAYSAGAFPGSWADLGAAVIFAPYRLENVRIDSYDVVVNQPKTETYRAPGGTNANFTCETVIDELCEKLGMDPLEFRLRNAVEAGDAGPFGTIYPRIGYRETVEAARAHSHYSAPLEGRYRGRGVATGYWGNYGGSSCASAVVNSDGTVILTEGSVDLGGSRASLAMQLAETLEIPVEEIKPLVADTDSVGYTEGSYGSRTTFATGWAVYKLGQNLKQQLIERAAWLWEISPEQISYANGIFATGDKSLSFRELAARLDETGSPVVASASVRPDKYGPAFAAHIVDVEVDPETGKIQILRYTAIQDVGTAIHPSFVEGQIQGGVAQGIGWAINEEYIYDEQGRLLNASLLDYRMPTFLDLPMIETVIVEVPNPGHPYGVRGVGEVPIVPPPAAIANAIYRAVGVRMSVLPMSPARILEALWAKEQG